MALKGIDPILTGPLLAHLDAMGHSDSVVIGDANFPAHRLATRLVELPGLTTPEVVARSAPSYRSTTVARRADERRRSAAAGTG